MKRLFAGMILAAAASGLATPVSAQEWPSRQPIKVIVSLSPGSATDVLARLSFEQVSKQIGQAIIIENRPGAGQRIGAAAGARAEPDGYTLLVNSSTHTVFPAMFTNLSFDVVRDFVALAPLASIPTVMVVPASRDWTSLADIIIKFSSTHRHRISAHSGKFAAHLSAIERGAQFLGETINNGLGRFGGGKGTNPKFIA